MEFVNSVAFFWVTLALLVVLGVGGLMMAALAQRARTHYNKGTVRSRRFVALSKHYLLLGLTILVGSLIGMALVIYMAPASPLDESLSSLATAVIIASAATDIAVLVIVLISTWIAIERYNQQVIAFRKARSTPSDEQPTS